MFRNRVLQLRHDGSWQYRVGIAICLPHLFLCLGRDYTAAELHGYYNTLETLAVKRHYGVGSEDECRAGRLGYPLAASDGQPKPLQQEVWTS